MWGEMVLRRCWGAEGKAVSRGSAAGPGVSIEKAKRRGNS